MLKENLQYVVRYWDSREGQTSTEIGFKKDIEWLQTKHWISDIRVWELETNDLKKVEL